jgi:adenylate cyclase class 2
MTVGTLEIECRFLEIDKKSLIDKLRVLGAHDKGERLLEEIIIYDPELTWSSHNKFIRLRNTGEQILLSYKEHNALTADGTYEIEFAVSDMDRAIVLFEKLGYRPHRRQQKLRHTFTHNDIVFDIDTWPKVPTYVEIEGTSEQALRDAAKLVGFEWKDVRFDNAGLILENVYKIPFRNLRWYTFDKME